MRKGKLLVEGTPAELRNRLEGRILELRGQPLSALRSLAEADPGVENAQMFGDRLHLRVHADQLDRTEGQREATPVEERLRERAVVEGAEITSLRSVPPQLEDVFISLVE
jgi:ABC-2 type transport system ATP-binding protein